MSAEESLAEGDLEEALAQLKESVRKESSNSRHRIFLFQLFAVMGQWERALNQLDVLAEIDHSTLAMVGTYRQAIQCEMLREEVFAGKRSPIVFGQPEQWMALLFEALKLTAEGQHTKSQEMRDQAFELAPVTSGTIVDPDGIAFNWISDADTRIGPMLEAIINGQYYWVPFHRISVINIVAPEDMRDMVWMPAYFTWANGGESVGFVPTRYPGSELSEENQIRTAHKTIWDEVAEDVYHGLGQRMFTTDVGEYSLMDLRIIKLDSPQADVDTDTASQFTSSEQVDH